MKTLILFAICLIPIVAMGLVDGKPDPQSVDAKSTTGSTPAITTALMFEGRAEEAMTLYTSLFKNSKVLAVDRWQEGEPGAAGKIKHAIFLLDGQVMRCMDSPVKHDFTFTPAASLFVSCATDAEVDELFAKLSPGGKVFMPLQAYPFAKKYAWLSDRFGVSWQLHLAHDSVN